MKANVAAIALIVFGTFFLLSNLELINVGLASGQNGLDDPGIAVLRLHGD